MCGILGVCGDQVPQPLFESALNALRHRGPDGLGYYRDEDVILGHRRLAIIDLSSEAQQPMQSSETGMVLTFNGEIYNYIELRDELMKLGHHFHSVSDTEVLLAAYIEWGRECLHKLNGMWAFAIWDPKKRRLFVARDRFGVKPFYFLCDGKRFAFASEPKALLAIYPEYRKVNHVALYDFFSAGALYHNGQSFYAGIEALPPAHAGYFDVVRGSASISRYWSYPKEQWDTQSLEEAEEAFSSIFNDAVRIRLRSDVEFGLTLSGGLDSTSILATTNSMHGASTKCFTSVYPGSDAGEEIWAERAASRENNPLIRAEASDDQWLATLSDIAWHMDGPGSAPAVYPLWNLMKKARTANVPVMLEGQGADELLGGYVPYAVLNFQRLLKNAILSPSGTAMEEIIRSWRGMRVTYPFTKIVLRLMRESFPMLLPVYRRMHGAVGTLRREFTESLSCHLGMDRASQETYRDAVNERLRQDHGEWVLPGLLHYGDAMSMAHGIESRHPFLDYRLVEWSFRQPPSIKLANGQTKWLVRRYLRRAGWSEFGNRWDKKGYPTPIGEWMQKNDGIMLRDILLASDSRVNEYCEPKDLHRLINKYIRGDNKVENHLYRLVSTEIWLKSCM